MRYKMSPATRRRRINQCEYRRYRAAVEIDISVDFLCRTHQWRRWYRTPQ